MDVESTENIVASDNENTSEIDNEDMMSPEAASNFMMQLHVLRNTSFILPKTVSLIECDNGTKVYLVGTAHFSKESIEDVINVMEHTLPDIVLVELCPNRSHSMILSEEEIQRQIRENSITKFVKDLGPSNGILQYLLLRFTSYIMDQIGMAPGGEFRAAFQQASKQPHCHVVLGDRPIKVTMQRTLNALGIWQKTKIFFSLLFGFEPITAEDVEAMKKEDLLEQLMKSLAGDYPELTRTILEERDTYLTKSIWDCCGFRKEPPTLLEERKSKNESEEDNEVRQRNLEKATGLTKEEEEKEDSCQVKPTLNPNQLNEQEIRCCPEWPNQSQLPRVVVAVVGLGHVAGIKRHWNTAGAIDKKELMLIKAPSISWTVFKWISKFAFLSSLAYGTYWLIYGVYRVGFYGCDLASSCYYRLVAV